MYFLFSEENDSDKENEQEKVQDLLESVTEVTEVSGVQTLTSKYEEKTEVADDSVIDEEILQMLGEDPSAAPENPVMLPVMLPK